MMNSRIFLHLEKIKINKCILAYMYANKYNYRTFKTIAISAWAKRSDCSKVSCAAVGSEDGLPMKYNTIRPPSTISCALDLRKTVKSFWNCME